MSAALAPELQLQSGQPHQAPWMRALHLVSVAAGCAFVIAGLLLAVVLRLVDGTGAYSQAPACTVPAQAFSTENRCYALVDARVLASQVRVGAAEPTMTLHADGIGPSSIVVTISRPSQVFYSITPGETVVMKVWRGQCTALYPGTDAKLTSAVRTAASPYETDNLRLSAGLFLLAIGAALLFIEPPRFALRWIGARTRWHSDADLVEASNLAATYRDTRIGIGFALFIVLQTLDVVSSLRGSAGGFFEDTPVVAELIRRWGEVPAFAATKLPAIIATALALPRLPRRIAVIVMWSGVAVMLYIVISNVDLIFFGQPGGQSG